jgi:endonuclease-3
MSATKRKPESSSPELRGPLGEDRRAMRTRALAILRSLKRAYPDARVPLNYSNPLELLVATILSAQCTDARVNEVTPGLFKRYRTARDWAEAPLDVLEDEIRPTGFFRNKARAIKESAGDIVERFDGRVPDSLDDLLSLRGVGRKSANVVIAHAFGGQGIIVDTHFTRLARRMGFTAEFDAVKIESDLTSILPRTRWSDFSLMLTWHGRTTCRARKPACDGCPVAECCPASASAGVLSWKVKNPAGKRPRKTARGTFAERGRGRKTK